MRPKVFKTNSDPNDGIELGNMSEKSLIKSKWALKI